METYKTLCRGHLPITQLPNVGPRCINFFICSAFTDFEQERRILQEQAYPNLREYCRSRYGLDFRAIDLKLGIEDLAWEELDYQSLFCSQRDKFCRASADCCPVILFGQKYGLPLLPKRIPSSIFNLLKSTLRAHRNSTTQQYPVLDRWYVRDENTANEPEHVLLPVGNVIPDIHSKDILVKTKALEEWKTTRKLLSSLIKISFAICLHDGNIDESMIYQILIYELDSGISTLLKESRDSGFQPIIFQREIVDLKNYLAVEKAGDFIDIVEAGTEGVVLPDKLLQDLLKELYDRLFSYHPPSNAPFSVLWRFSDGIDLDLHREYLADLCEAFTEACRRAVDERASSRVLQEDKVATRVYDEVWTSLRQCHTLSFFSAGHEQAVEAIVRYVQDPAVDIPMVLYGPSDAGKAPVVARSVYELQKLLPDNPELFIITRIYSYQHKLTHLVRSVFDQLKSVLNRLLPYTVKCSSSLSDILTALPKLHRFVLLIAGTEHLVDNEGKPVNIIDHLPLMLPENVRIVVTSTLDKAELSPDLLNCPVRAFQAEDFANFIEIFLKYHGRALISEQLEVVRSCTANMDNLFQVSIVGEELCKLCSFHVITMDSLPSTNADCFRMMFSFLEGKYGTVLVSHVATFLTASEDGLSDQEMEDVLSLDDEVMREVGSSNSHDIKRFPTVLWLLLKHDMRILLAESCRQGYIVTYWANQGIADVVNRKYIPNERVKVYFHYILADYFLGVWHGIAKPYIANPKTEDGEEGPDAATNETPIAANRLVPSQDIMYSYNHKTFSNVRQYKQLPRHLLHSERREELFTLVLFSYDWIFHKTQALGLEEMLKDYALVDQQNVEVSLVEETIRKSTSIIENNLGILSPELIGQLLPYSYLYKNIKNLVRQCDLNGVTHSGFLPTYPYPKLPGSALQSTVVCPSALQAIEIDEKGGKLYVKMEEDTKLYEYNLVRGELSQEVTLSSGEFYPSADFKLAVLLDDQHRRAVKVHRLSDGAFLGQIVPINWIETRPFEQKHAYRITLLDVGEKVVALTLTNEISYIFVVQLDTCKPLHIFRPEKRATLCRLSPNWDFVYTSAGDQLMGFELSSGKQVAAVDLLAKPLKMIFTSSMSRAFLMCKEEQRVVILHLRDGYVEMSYKIVFENSLGSDDHVHDIRIAANDELLLIRGAKNILVYDFGRDAIVAHMKRPPEIPQDFKLPNSEYTALNFTEADFAFDDKVIVSAIFRDILIWSIADGRPLAMLHAPVGIITRLVVDRSRKGLIGYIGHSKEIHLWSLNGAFTDGTVIDALTSPIACIHAAQSASRALAICASSDEMGVVDLHSGFLTDLYTHEGLVERCAISSCGDFALVAIKQKRPGTSNIVWCLKTRRILKEFGDRSGAFLSMLRPATFIHVVAKHSSFQPPYEVTMVHCAEAAEDTQVEHTNAVVKYLLVPPFITADDRHLVVMSAEDYLERKAYYIAPRIGVWRIDNTGGDINYIDASMLSCFTECRRILHVRACPRLDTGAIVLFSPDETDYLNLRAPNTDDLPRAILILDVEKVSVLRVVGPDLLPLEINVESLIFSADGHMCIDQATRLFSLEAECFLGQMVPAGSMTFHCFALNDTAVVLSSKTIIYAIRMPECTLFGKADVHDQVSFVISTGPKERTILVGCANGNILSFTLVDQINDDVEAIIQTIPSREMLDKDRTRSWDRLVPDSGGDYSRPPSISIAQRQQDMMRKLASQAPTNIEEAAAQRANAIPGVPVRPSSDTAAYRMQQTRSCNVM